MTSLGNKVLTCQKCFKLISNVRRRQGILVPLSSCGRQKQSYYGTSDKTKFETVPQNSHCHSPHRLTKFSRQIRCCTTSSDAKESPTTQTTIDEDEHRKFVKLAAQWWDEKGEFYALHSMNKLRIPLIRDALVNNMDSLSHILPLKDKHILDVGSGGGIIAEPLARLGATVVGVDMVEENIRVAQTHLMEDPIIVERVKYIHGAVEDLVMTEEGRFDAVVASEVVEHVSDIDMFISSCCKLLKPGGSLLITTLNKTYLSYGLAVFGAEQLFRVVPSGTHDWEKFVPPEDLQLYLEKNDMIVKLLHGMCYNPVINKWSWMSDTSINYALHAVKLIHTEHS